MNNQQLLLKILVLFQKCFGLEGPSSVAKETLFSPMTHTEY
jgi:hypothetical protein